MSAPNLLSERRANPSRDNYIFISYSHADSEKVYKDLQKLYDEQVNYWYDKELYVGDKWDEVVKVIIEQDHCKGALLYISKNSLKSEAVEKEIKTIFEKQKRNPNFSVILVSPYNLSVLEIIRDIFVSSQDLNGAELEKDFPQERLKTIVEYLTKNILYLVPSENNAHIEEIKKTYKTKKIPVFADDESLLDIYKSRLNIVDIDGNYKLTFGGFPQGESKDLGCPFKDGLTEYNRKKYYTVNKKTYDYTRVVWNMLRLNGRFMTIFPSEVMVFNSLNEIESTLNKEFIELAFCGNEESIVQVDIPDISILKEIENRVSLPVKINSYTKDKSVRFPVEILVFKENENFVLFNRSLKKINAPIKSNTMGFVLPLVTIDLTKV